MMVLNQSNRVFVVASFKVLEKYSLPFILSSSEFLSFIKMEEKPRKNTFDITFDKYLLFK